MASSAKSNDWETRIKPAIMRPDSLRKTSSTALRKSVIVPLSVIRFGDPTRRNQTRAQSEARRSAARSAAARRQDGLTLRPLREFVNRADFHAAGSATAACGNLGSPFQGFIEIGAVENVVAGKLLLGFGKRPVGHERFSVLEANCRRRGSVL